MWVSTRGGTERDAATCNSQGKFPHDTWVLGFLNTPVAKRLGSLTEELNTNQWLPPTTSYLLGLEQESKIKKRDIIRTPPLPGMPSNSLEQPTSPHPHAHP